MAVLRLCRSVKNVTSTINALGNLTVSEVIDELCRQVTDANFEASFREFQKKIETQKLWQGLGQRLIF